MRKSLLILVSVVFTLTSLGCSTTVLDPFEKEAPEVNASETNAPEANEPETDTSETKTFETETHDYLSDPSKLDFNLPEGELIYLDGDRIYSRARGVTIKNTTVTITDEGSYVVQGTLYDGQLIIDAGRNDIVNIHFKDTDLTSLTSASLYLLKACTVNITADAGTTISIVNGGEFLQTDENNIDGAIFAKTDLTLSIDGAKLIVNSPVGNGIVAKDTLKIGAGSYQIESAGHGIDVNDSLTVDGAHLNITSGRDGIHVENNDDVTLGGITVYSGDFCITSAGDGISAAAAIEILDGIFIINSGGGYENGEEHYSGGPGMGGFGGGRPGGMGEHGSTTQTESEDIVSCKGIKSSGEMRISGGEFTIDSADDSIHSNSSILISDGIFNICTGDDGIHADDTLETVNGEIIIDQSYEGLEALNIVISGGDITIFADDDGINAAGGTDSSGFGGNRPGGDRFGGGMGQGTGGSIKISGGNIYINASGDGIDSNGTLEISGGYTVVCGPTKGDTSTLDYDTSATISGGTFIGTGAYGMAQTFNDVQQGVIAVSVGNQAAGSEIKVLDSEGEEILAHTPDLSFAVVIISSPDISSGEIYTLTIAELTGEVEAQ